PVAWHRPASVGPLVEEELRLTAHCQGYVARRAGPLSAFDAHLPQANLDGLVAHLTTAHGNLDQRLPRPSQAADTAVELRSELGSAFSHIGHILEQANARAASLASVCGVPAPDTLAGAMNLGSLADLIVQDPRPERHWFGRGQIAFLKAAAEEAHSRYTQYQRGRGKLGERYDDSYLSLDHAAL